MYFSGYDIFLDHVEIDGQPNVAGAIWGIQFNGASDIYATRLLIVHCVIGMAIYGSEHFLLDAIDIDSCTGDGLDIDTSHAISIGTLQIWYNRKTYSAVGQSQNAIQIGAPSTVYSDNNFPSDIILNSVMVIGYGDGTTNSNALNLICCEGLHIVTCLVSNTNALYTATGSIGNALQFAQGSNPLTGRIDNLETYGVTSIYQGTSPSNNFSYRIFANGDWMEIGDFTYARIPNFSNGITGAGTIGTLTCPWSNLTDIPSDFAKYDQANTWSSLQTFNSGITGAGSIGTLTVPWANLLNIPTDLAKVDANNTFSSLQTFSVGITGTGTTGGLTAGFGILGTENTWNAQQNFNYSPWFNAGISGSGSIVGLNIPWNSITGVPIMLGSNISVASSATSTSVTFTTAQPDTNFALVLTPNWLTTFAVAKTATNFTVTWGTPPSATQSFDWVLIR